MVRVRRTSLFRPRYFSSLSLFQWRMNFNDGFRGLALIAFYLNGFFFLFSSLIRRIMNIGITVYFTRNHKRKERLDFKSNNCFYVMLQEKQKYDRFFSQWKPQIHIIQPKPHQPHTIVSFWLKVIRTFSVFLFA